ncbi:hypothetical protein LTR56_005791 [Elasticomyces elasticus]|nr:hypothetical protein LTR22_019451 [Elasticomyces elasticus]KAK3651334.1 hypothetical protein LTR56_005791 [Elasticomyces elasticus]KAK4925722.1 hypothetical protein LTR49_007332 [Elasticomyces elasticus]KAK5765054.1 hypothetical protein LTS12_004832 [Elasticomyces elasticus]
MAPHLRKASDSGSADGKAKTGNKAEEKHTNLSTDGPRNAVFATAELLEQILMFLPPTTVFGIQRVCRQFRDILATSAALQGKVWLRAPQSLSDEVWTVIGPKLVCVLAGYHYKYPATRVVRIANTDAFPENAIGMYGDKEPPRSRLARCFSPSLKHRDIHTDSAMKPMRWLLERVGSAGELCVFEKYVPLLGPGSWKNTYMADFRSTDVPCKSATVRLRWAIAEKPLISGTVYLQATRTDEVHGFTLGMLVEAAFDAAEDRFCHYEWHRGDERQESSGPLIKLIERLQTETGERAYMEVMAITTSDVVLPTDAERDMVGDV